jgi:hypothetical protein
MPITKQMDVPVEQNEMKTVTREIHNILILTTSNVYWEVWTWDGILYPNNDLVKDPSCTAIKREFYNIPFMDIYKEAVNGEIAGEIERILWIISESIDALPETTMEERRIKFSRTSAFSYNINQV